MAVTTTVLMFIAITVVRKTGIVVAVLEFIATGVVGLKVNIIMKEISVSHSCGDGTRYIDSNCITGCSGAGEP